MPNKINDTDVELVFRYLYLKAKKIRTESDELVMKSLEKSCKRVQLSQVSLRDTYLTITNDYTTTDVVRSNTNRGLKGAEKGQNPKNAVFLLVYHWCETYAKALKRPCPKQKAMFGFCKNLLAEFGFQEIEGTMTAFITDYATYQRKFKLSTLVPTMNVLFGFRNSIFGGKGKVASDVY